MNADAFRHLYEYHFTANRKLWESWVVPLTQAQFVQPVEYSVGSVRNQVVHMMNVDKGWFSDLRGVENPTFIDAAELPRREEIRTHWDEVEEHMRDYLATLTDDLLFTKPLTGSPDDRMYLWQILLHVANHGTDHRAQLLRILHDLGMKTEPQDYFFYVVDDF